jgi:hypothetical protein
MEAHYQMLQQQAGPQLKCNDGKLQLLVRRLRVVESALWNSKSGLSQLSFLVNPRGRGVAEDTAVFSRMGVCRELLTSRSANHPRSTNRACSLTSGADFSVAEPYLLV